MGKLEEGKLMGGEEGDSEDEVTAEDVQARQVLEMLLRGEVTNIGPQPEYSLSNSLQSPESHPTQSLEIPIPVPAEEPPASALRPKPSKVSKFKLALQQPYTVANPPSPGLSSTAGTPINVVERSSPKMHTAGDTTPQSPSKHLHCS